MNFKLRPAAPAQLYFCAQFSCTDFDLLNLTAGAQQQQQQQQQV